MAPHDPAVKNPARDADDIDDDDDALFAELEKEDDSSYRAHRIEQLHAEFSSVNPSSSNTSRPTTLVENTQYPTLTTDKALLDFTTDAERCVIHFAHPDFARCGVMDEHLRGLATLHHEVRFARVDVRNTPFVVEKLNVRVLPYVIGFKDGLAVERVIGFEGLGSGGQRDAADGFSTRTLERRLLYKGVLVKARLGDGEGGALASGGSSDSDDDEHEKGRNGQRKTIRSGIAGRNKGRYDDGDDNDWD